MNRIKRLLAAFLCFALAVSLCACGKDAEQGTTAATTNVASNTSGNSGSTAKITVDLPEGWYAVEGSVLEHQYMKNTASFILKYEVFSSDTLAGVADEAEAILSSYFDGYQTVGEREYIRVGGKDAVKLSFTCKMSNITMKYTYVYLFLDGRVCALTFGDFSSSFDALTADIAYILEHVSFNAQ